MRSGRLKLLREIRSTRLNGCCVEGTSASLVAKYEVTVVGDTLGSAATVSTVATLNPFVGIKSKAL